MHPWLLDSQRPQALQTVLLNELKCAGIHARCVFGRMYTWHEQVASSSVSDAICVPAACLLKIISLAPTLRRENQIVIKALASDGQEQQCVSMEETQRIASLCVSWEDGGEEVLTVYVLDGCAIRATHAQKEVEADSVTEDETRAEEEALTDSEAPNAAQAQADTEAISTAEVAEGHQTLIRLVRHALHILGQNNIQASLLYGTLLGKVRQGGIMAHDHDCDLLVAATSAAHVLSLASELEAGGQFMLTLCVGLLNHQDDASVDFTLEEYQQRFGADKPIDLNQVNQFKLYDRAAWESGRDGWCFCDFFLYDLVGEHVRVREDHCYLIPMPIKLVLPFRRIQFLDEDCWEPAEAEAWLTFQYGQDWRVRSSTMGWLSTSGLHHDAWLWFHHA